MKACAYAQTQNNSIIKKSKLKFPLSFSELLNASHSLLENISLHYITHYKLVIALTHTHMQPHKNTLTHV